MSARYRITAEALLAFCKETMPADNAEGAIKRRYWRKFERSFGAGMYPFLIDQKHIEKIPVDELGWGLEGKRIFPKMLRPQLGEVWVLFCFSDELKQTIRANPTCPIRQDGFLLSLEWRDFDPAMDNDKGAVDSPLLSPSMIKLAKLVREHLVKANKVGNFKNLKDEDGEENYWKNWGLYPSKFRYHDEIDFSDESLFGSVDSAYGALLASYQRDAAVGGHFKNISLFGKIVKCLFGKTRKNKLNKTEWTFPTLQWKRENRYEAGISGVSGLKDKFSVAADFGARVVTVAKEQVPEAKRELANLYGESKDPRFKKMAVYGVSANDNSAELARDILRGPIQYLKRIRIRKIATWISIGILTPALLLLCGMLVHDYPSKSCTDGFTAQRQYEIGKELLYRIFFKRGNRRNAITWLSAAAESGLADAQYELGAIYEEGAFSVGDGIDESEALRWYKLAAEKQHPKALAKVAWYYLFGRGGLISDFDKAVPYLYSSATNGFAVAQVVLGKAYETGEIVGETNILKACQFYSMAAAQGDDEAMFRLYCLYSQGREGIPKNSEVARVWLEDAVGKGNPAAMAEMGANYLHLIEDLGFELDEPKGIRLLKKAVSGNNVPAFVYLGLCYENGKGVAVNRKTAAELYLQAAKSGNATAQYCIATCYHEGLGVDKDDKKSIAWLEQSSAQGHAGADFQLGVMYENGWGAQRDLAKAVKRYERAAEHGDARAMFSLGLYYQDGKGGVQDKQLALKWYKDAAKKNHAGAQCNLGYMYDKGIATETNRVMALHYYQLAASNGDACAKYNLGLAYEHGDGVSTNHQAAFSWYSQAAEGGYADAEEVLGEWYFSGLYVEQDFQKALDMYTRAVEHRSSKSAVAKNDLGIMYKIGKAVQQDYDRAFELFKDAACSGLAAAQYNIGLCYLKAEGCATNDYEAVAWLKKSAAQGYADAQFILGVLYESGRGVDKSNDLANQWYAQAATQNHTKAQIELGRMYELGLGVSPNARVAQYWYGKAAETGNAEAQYYLYFGSKDETRAEDDLSWLLREALSSECPIEITIDQNLQRIVEETLIRYADTNDTGIGWSVVLSAKDGAVLAIADCGEVMDRTLPLAATYAFEVGQLATPFMVAAAFEEKLATPSTKLSVDKEEDYFKQWKLPSDGGAFNDIGYLSISNAISFSSNVVLAKLGVLVGPKRVHEIFSRFGFGQKTGVAIRVENGGRLKESSRLGLQGQSRMSVGQGVIGTALQIARAYAELANRGRGVKPFILRRILNSSGDVLYEHKTPHDVEQVVPSDVAKDVCSILEGAVLDDLCGECATNGKEGSSSGGNQTHRHPTGRRASVKGVRIAGKTSTMMRMKSDSYEYDFDRYIASFAGFFPADDPKYVIVVCYETRRIEGVPYIHHGGGRPAMCFAEIVRKIYDIQKGK